MKPLIFLAVGAIAGGSYLGALEWNVRLYCRETGIRLALAIHLLRLLAVVIIFVAIARAGAAPLLWSFAGFHITRLSTLGLKAFPSGTLL
jgi:F1F0 ATPase subunit 2